jgi:hypothetical protein
MKDDKGNGWWTLFGLVTTPLVFTYWGFILLVVVPFAFFAIVGVLALIEHWLKEKL